MLPSLITLCVRTYVLPGKNSCFACLMQATTEASRKPPSFYPPYLFRQDEDSVNVSFQVAKGTAKSDLQIKITNNQIQAGLKGAPPVIEVRAR